MLNINNVIANVEENYPLTNQERELIIEALVYYKEFYI